LVRTKLAQISPLDVRRICDPSAVRRICDPSSAVTEPDDSITTPRDHEAASIANRAKNFSLRRLSDRCAFAINARCDRRESRRPALI